MVPLSWGSESSRLCLDVTKMDPFELDHRAMRFARVIPFSYIALIVSRSSRKLLIEFSGRTVPSAG